VLRLADDHGGKNDKKHGTAEPKVTHTLSFHELTRSPRTLAQHRLRTVLRHLRRHRHKRHQSGDQAVTDTVGHPIPMMMQLQANVGMGLIAQETRKNHLLIIRKAADDLPEQPLNVGNAAPWLKLHHNIGIKARAA
jgi:hypothetical protein